jgi:hypothetical protein
MAPDASVCNAPTNGAAALTAFRARSLADPALQAALGAIEYPDDFAGIAIRIARQHGIALTAEAVTSHRKTLPNRLDRWPPSGWLPARSVPTDDGLAINWTWAGSQPPTEAFYIAFIPDAFGKRAAASPHVRRAADAQRPVHARLDALRHRHAGH